MIAALTNLKFIFIHSTKIVLKWNSVKVLDDFEGGDSSSVLNTYASCKILRGGAKERFINLIVSILSLVNKKAKSRGTAI